MTEPVRAAIRTLGCKVNRVESETFAADLIGRGVLLTCEDDADVIIINTCTVTAEADAKARKAVRKALSAARSPLVVVTGCAASMDAPMLEALGDRVVVEVDKGRVVSRVSEHLRVADHGVPVTRSGPHFRTRAMLKVQDGCDAFCSYCVVPHARGVPRSVPILDIERQAADLAQAGVAEVVLTGVNLGRYRDGDAALSEVVRRVAETGVRRVRLSSIEVRDLNDELLATMSEVPGVCPHLHVPLQSGSDRVLSLMKRNYDMAEFEGRIAAGRGVVSGLTVTTDVIAGFPGESDADFEQTREACRRIGFSKIHVFRYSARRNTPAAESPDQVPPVLRRARARALADDGESLAAAYLESRKGVSTEVLVEKRIGNTAVGTAPDHVSVSVSSASAAQVGELLLVRIADVSTGGLIGEIL